MAYLCSFHPTVIKMCPKVREVILWVSECAHSAKYFYSLAAVTKTSEEKFSFCKNGSIVHIRLLSLKTQIMQGLREFSFA